MANSGSKITLKAFEFIPNLTRNISNNPELSNNTPSEVNLGSLENMKFTIRCVLNPSTDGDDIYYLLDLVSTNGYKLMWYDYDYIAEVPTHQLIYRIASNPKFGHLFTSGEMTKWGLSIAHLHLHVLFTSLTPRHTADNGFIQYDLEGIVLPVKTSII